MSRRGPTAGGEVDRVVVVGRRRAALRAVQELGLEAVLVAPQALRRGLPRPVAHVAWDPDDDPLGEELAGRVADLGPGAAPVAILAATEAAVRPAAALRGALGLQGLDPDAARRCTDKLEMKRAVDRRGIPCARFHPVDAGTDPDDLVSRLGLPLVLKRRTGSGGRGTLLVRRADELPACLAGEWLAEAFVDGTEISVEAFLAAGEARLVNFTEYLEPRWANQLPAMLPGSVAAEVRRLLERSVAALGVERGVVHMEVFLTRDGPVFGELAARPPGGYIMELLALAWEFPAWRAWVQLELGGDPSLPPAPVAHAASRILHPGPGTVRAAGGLEAARETEGVVEVRLRVDVGDRLEPRRGAGQEAGHVIVRAASRERAVEALTRACERIDLRVEPGATA